MTDKEEEKAVDSDTTLKYYRYADSEKVKGDRAQHKCKTLGDKG